MFVSVAYVGMILIKVYKNFTSWLFTVILIWILSSGRFVYFYLFQNIKVFSSSNSFKGTISSVYLNIFITFQKLIYIKAS